MKKSITSIVLGCIVFTAMEKSFAQGIYQLPNPGFENGWYLESSNSGSIVPIGFHSFYSASGSVASLGAAKRCDSSRVVRNGAAGNFSLKLFSTTVLTVRANGNVTTGRINAGSTSASNVENYNYTDIANGYFQEITGRPDSLRFWVRYVPGRTGTTNTTDKGRVRFYIHGIGECRDAPVYPSGVFETDYYYGKAMKEFYKENGGWHQYTVPFEYTGNNIQRNANGNYYILVSMTTNATPGGGANNPDSLYIDDIEFIYAAYLSDLKINGTTIAGFEKNLLTYGGPKLVGTPGSFTFPYNASNITAIPESDSSRSVVITNVNGPGGDADGGYTSIIVTAEDNVSTKEYRIYYYANLSDNNNMSALCYTMDGAMAISVPSFSPSTLNYNITLTNPEEVRIPQIVDTSIVLADSKAEIYSITQPTGVNSSGSVKVRAENYAMKVYTLTFSKVISTNSKLDWIKIGGTNIANFHPDTLAYDTNITACVTAIPTITAAASSPWARVSIVQGTMSNRTATITVKAENGDSTVYTINFVLINNNATLSGCRIGTTNYNFPVGNVYVHTASFIAAQTLTIQDAQKNCGAATIVRDTSATLYFPDTNIFTVTAQDGITTETYKVVIKNTNCFVATGNNSGFRFNYNGQTNQNTAINITTTNNGNLNPVVTSVVTLPVGPNVPPELVVYGLAAAATAAPPTYIIDQPKHRNDTATVTLTANDGVTQKIYRVPFKATLSDVATLSNIKCNDSLIVGFAPNITSYTVMLPANATQVPTIVGIPTFQWLPSGNIVVVPAVDLLDTTKIIVTAENGTTTKIYYIDFDVEPVDNAYLSVLKYDNNVIAGFRPTKLTYSVDIPYSTTTPPVLSGTPMAANASVFYSQPTTQPYQGKVLVFSENMMGQKIYTVNFNLVKNTDATLADIKINGVSLQGFNPQVFTYNELLPYTEMNAPMVSATPTHPFAQVSITQINSVAGTVTINVTAEDNLYTATYTIDFTRELSPIIDLDTVKYVYNSQNYACDASNSGTTITIVLPVETEGIPNITDIVLADNRANFTIDNQPSLINNLTGTVTVTAEDLATEMYEIYFQRTLSASTLLTTISYNTVSVPNFDPNILTYYVILPFNTSQIPVVTATADWKNTGIAITQPTNPFGQATILVTSEDGLNTKTYTIIFQRKGNPDLISLSYNLGGTSIPVPNFDASILEYNITLPIGTTDIPLLEYVAADPGVGRCVIDTIQQTTPNGTSQLVITTWNQDATLTYTVNFTVALSTEALLLDLQVDGVTIDDFNPLLQLNYAMKVDYEYGISTFPEITAVATQPDARIEITSITSYPGTAIIKVYAGDTTISRTYTIAFSMDLGNNSYLSEISIDKVPLWNFKKNVLFYEIKLPYGTTQVPEVSATVEDVRANFVVVQASQMGDTATIYVVALNGEETHYKIVFTVRKNPNALAKNIFIDWKALEGFEPTKRNYTYTLPDNYGGVPFVSVELQNPNATYTVIPPTTIPAQIQIIITAEDTDSTFSYRINLEKNVSIVSYDNQTEIKVYPNPTTGQLTINNEQLTIKSVELFDIVGKKLSHFTIHDSQFTIDISHLSAGMYFLKIDSKTVKIVKQ